MSYTPLYPQFVPGSIWKVKCNVSVTALSEGKVRGQTNVLRSYIRPGTIFMVVSGCTLTEKNYGSVLYEGRVYSLYLSRFFDGFDGTCDFPERLM